MRSRHVPLSQSDAQQPSGDRPNGGAGGAGQRRPHRRDPARERHVLALAVAPRAEALVPMRHDARVFLQGFGVPDSVVSDVVLSLQEACKNAIRFAHSKRDIDVTVAVGADAIQLVVHDHGAGFHPSARTRTPATPPDPLAQHGRGLFLIGALMDDVQIVRDHGAVVIMRRRLRR